MGGRTAAAIAALVAGLTLTATAAADPDTPPPPPPDHGTAAPAAPGATAPPPPPGPVPMDHDGTFAVGGQIMPGVYTSGGPLPGDTCYWRRIGAGNATLENALTKQPQTVQIQPGDVAFKTNGCQPWQPAPPGVPPPGQNPPWLSQLQLRHNLDILNGLAGQSGNGQLPPY